MLKANGVNFKTIIDVGVGDKGTPVFLDLFPEAKHILIENDTVVLD